MLPTTDNRRPRQRFGAYEVITDPYRFDLRDDSLHTIHPIATPDGDHVFLRGYESTSGAISVVDLRKLSAALADELLRTPAVDVFGLIKFTLRGIYPTGYTLQRAVNEHAIVVGWVVGSQHQAVAA